jgi:hypothetical protein
MLAGDFSTITSPICNADAAIPLRAPIRREQPHPDDPLLACGGQHRRAVAETNDPCGRVDFTRKTHNFENLARAEWTTR